MSHAADLLTGGGSVADVSDLSLGEILRGPTALGAVLERLRAETRSHEGPYAGFGNFAPDDDPDETATTS